MSSLSSQFAGNETVLEVVNTRLYVQGQDRGAGLLSIRESCVNWSRSASVEESSDGSSSRLEDDLSLEYPSISLHAICRDTSVFPYPCLYILYCQEEEEEEEEEEEDEGSPIEKITEMRFVPSSSSDLDGLYSALCECQALYPDPDVSSDSQYDEGEELEEGDEDVDINLADGNGVFYTSVEEGFPNLSPQGMATLEHIEQVIQMPRPEEFEAMLSEGVDRNGSQFEDAGEDQDDL